MEIFLITLFALVTSIPSKNVHAYGVYSTYGYVADRDDSSEESSEFTRHRTKDPNLEEQLNIARLTAVTMTPNDLKIRGYPQTGQFFTSLASEEQYFENKYPNSMAERKCYQYKNEILRQRFMEEDTIGNPGIINGTNVTIENYPYMGALGYELNDHKIAFLCGCTLISHHFALTAAHCASKAINNEPTKPEIVRFGTTNIKELGVDYNIDYITQYDKYKRAKNIKKRERYDIALVHVVDIIRFSEVVQPACLWPSADTSSLRNISVSGWGATRQDGTQSSSVLQTAQMEIIDTQTCEEKYHTSGSRNKHIANEQMCASKPGVDSCQGDSGGPLAGISDDIKFIIGIVSHGYGCALYNVSGIYTRVSSYVSWIEDIVWTNKTE